MQRISVSPNLFFCENPAFGNYSQSVIFDILRFVDLNMSKALGLVPFSTKRCLIDASSVDNPVTYDYGDIHLILLSTHDDYWGQWVYQFAHEYCHHFINGTFSGEIKGLLWFEEMICEVSSIYNLYSIADDWSKSPLQSKLHFVPSLRQYARHCIGHSEKIPTGQYRKNGGLDYYTNNHTNSQLTYNRNLYTCLGVSSFLPQVIENPKLWRIILHIGDIRGYQSLEELFGHLFDCSDPSYVQSLANFQRLLYKMVK